MMSRLDGQPPFLAFTSHLSMPMQVRIAKNTILRRAIEGDAKWSVVGDQLESSNMWFFVGSDFKVRLSLDVDVDVCVCGTMQCWGQVGSVLPFSVPVGMTWLLHMTRTSRSVTTLPSFYEKGTFEGFEKFIKENKNLKDSHTYRFGAIDGELLDTAGVQKVRNKCGSVVLGLVDRHGKKGRCMRM